MVDSSGQTIAKKTARTRPAIGHRISPENAHVVVLVVVGLFEELNTREKAEKMWFS